MSEQDEIDATSTLAQNMARARLTQERTDEDVVREAVKFAITTRGDFLGAIPALDRLVARIESQDETVMAVVLANDDDATIGAARARIKDLRSREVAFEETLAVRSTFVPSAPGEETLADAAAWQTLANLRTALAALSPEEPEGAEK